MDLGFLHKHILDVALETLNADSGSILLLDSEKKELRINAAVGISDEVRETFTAKLGEGICGWVALRGEALLLSGQLEHETRFRPFARKKQITSAICAPLRAGDQILGVINLNKTQESPLFKKDDLDLLVTLANFAAIVLEKSRLHASLDLAHADLRVTVDELAALFETANDAIIVFSPEDGKIRKVNYEAARLTGLARKDLLAKDFRALFHPSDLPRLNQLIAQAARTGSARADELTMFRHDGTSVHVRFSASLTGYGKREVIQAVIGDITERKKMEQHLARTERLRALGELASGVAHDFGNIIGAILGYCQRLRRNVQAEPDKKAVEIIEKSARDGAEIVRRIQDATRMRSASSYTAVPLPEIVRDAVAYSRSRWKDLVVKGARIEVAEKLGFTGCVRGNAAELREVFTNILLNATDAMPKGGVITIESSRAAEMALVKIMDAGVGMTPEVRDKIFDPFFSTKGPDGTGLGLSIAYSIISSHKGRIDVESKPGEGSAFIVYLPVSTEPPALTKNSGPAPSIPRLKYLVIDDDERMCQVVADMLKQHGERVFTATSPGEGLILYKREKPQIVITDLKMPGQSGVDVSRIIKGDDPATRVIIITAARAELTNQEMAASRVDHVLPKPFDEAELAHAIAKVWRPPSQV
jgi:PAS domain S-box-containing protein